MYRGRFQEILDNFGMPLAKHSTERAELRKTYFEIRISSVAPTVPLKYDIFLFVNESPVLFRRIGDTLTEERIRLLYNHGRQEFLVREDQRELYVDSLRHIIHDPGASIETKSKFLKETAYVHINDLFTKEDIAPAVSEASRLTEQMVSFVSNDLEAACTLMRLSRHDYYTYNHCVDVAVYSIVLARKVFGEKTDLLLMAGLGGLLHDIGKRDIDWNLINKTSALTQKEWDEIRKHPVYGKDCLESVPSVPDASRLVVLEHHENFDGTGYPFKLSGDQISPLAKIVTIADVFDALTTDRSYHRAMSPKEALNLMFGMQPGKFDPALFTCFNSNFTRAVPVKLVPDFDPCSPVNPFQK